MAIALFIGISSAIYLNEYSKQGRFVHFLRLAILNLAGVPSIVFGLFGMGMFVLFMPLLQNFDNSGAPSLPELVLVDLPLGEYWPEHGGLCPEDLAEKVELLDRERMPAWPHHAIAPRTLGSVEARIGPFDQRIHVGVTQDT